MSAVELGVYVLVLLGLKAIADGAIAVWTIRRELRELRRDD